MLTTPIGEWSSYSRSPSAFFCLYAHKAQLPLLGRRTDDFYPPLCPVLLLITGLFLGCNVYERVLAFLGFQPSGPAEVDSPPQRTQPAMPSVSTP